MFSLFIIAAGQDNDPDAFNVAHAEDLLRGERNLPIFANFVLLVEVLEYGLVLVVLVLLFQVADNTSSQNREHSVRGQVAVLDVHLQILDHDITDCSLFLWDVL